MTEVRAATEADWPAMWRLMRPIVEAGETYAYDPAMSEAEARAIWMHDAPGRTAVALVDGAVAGTYAAYPNRAGNGSHVASASFMVDEALSGNGVGRAMGEDMIAWARDAGFRAIQFNAVVEANKPAVHLWRSLGFEIVGTVPEAFDHPREGLVGLHVMYLPLAT